MKRWEKRIEKAWDQESMCIDWLGFEYSLREILRDVQDLELTPMEGVEAVDQVIQAFTRRGSAFQDLCQ